jgi:putative ABC transport system permease protein
MFGRRRRTGDDFDAEIRAHLQLEIDRLEEQGLAPDAARAAARRAFGNVTRTEERFYESSRPLWWDHLSQDVRYSIRTLTQTRGFTFTAIATMAIGIGATTAIFSLVNATLLRPLPYPDPDRLVTVAVDLPGVNARDVGMSQPEWVDLQRSGAFEFISPVWFDENNVTGGARPARVRIVIVAPNYFELLAVRAQLGRTFEPRDHSPGVLPDVVISDSLWKRGFGADPRILEKSIKMDTDVYHIVGVMPPGFDAPGRKLEERNVDIWAETNFYGMPMRDHPPRAGRNLPTAIARLAPGLTLTSAQRRLDALAAELRQQYPSDYPAQSGLALRLVPLKERIVGDVRRPLILLFAAVGVVLLIGCANVANLLLARGTTRARELAMRQALGAGRRRLIRQLLTESVLLSVAGGVGGLLLLAWAQGFLVRAMPDTLPRFNPAALDWRVLAFAVAASLATGVGFGIVPALQVNHIDPGHVIKQGDVRGSSSRHAGTRRVLIVGEFALSLVLLAGAGLLVRTFHDLVNVELGFDRENVMIVRTRLPAPNDPTVDRYRTAAQESQFLRELVRRGRTLPGVEDVAIGDTAAIPLDEAARDLKVISEGSYFIALEDRPETATAPFSVERSSVTPEYFRLLGLHVVRGRAFNEADDANAPMVAVINEAFARTSWPGQDPVGKRFRRVRSGSPWVTVVGTIANARTESLANGSIPKVYLNLHQNTGNRLAIFLRGHFDPVRSAERMRIEVQKVDSTLPVFDARTLRDTVSSSLDSVRFSMATVSFFALTALALAAIGIYGVMAYVVSGRTHEIGIRVALGAPRSAILGSVLHEGLQLTLIGAAVGLGCALIATRLIAGVLYGVSPSDPATFAAVVAALVAVALLACVAPVWRAMRIDPTIALRHEQ